uniref:Hemoglobin subunit alpha-D n=1 Tax=Anoplopoma fimbria TaxID=229290 RepID=C3KI34_ANOFI|nr:Hemoglobin subunit alpha-D [Anoplopoma fimbria]
MLSKKQKELIAEIWGRLTPVADDIGADALHRMFASYPGTKTYFSHLDISPRSAHMLSHGKKIVLANPARLPAPDRPDKLQGALARTSVRHQTSKSTSCKKHSI